MAKQKFLDLPAGGRSILTVYRKPDGLATKTSKNLLPSWE
jgi:hypothetical protein